jgi:hypothetical protein
MQAGLRNPITCTPLCAPTASHRANARRTDKISRSASSTSHPRSLPLPRLLLSRPEYRSSPDARHTSFFPIVIHPASPPLPRAAPPETRASHDGEAHPARAVQYVDRTPSLPTCPNRVQTSSPTRATTPSSWATRTSPPSSAPMAPGSPIRKPPKSAGRAVTDSCTAWTPSPSS